MEGAMKDLLMELYIKFGTRQMPYKEYMEVVGPVCYDTINWADFYGTYEYIQFDPNLAAEDGKRVYRFTSAALKLIKEPNE